MRFKTIRGHPMGPPKPSTRSVKPSVEWKPIFEHRDLSDVSGHSCRLLTKLENFTTLNSMESAMIGLNPVQPSHYGNSCCSECVSCAQL